LGLSGSYGQVFQEAETRAQKCAATAAGSTLEECKNLPVGAPVREDHLTLRGELRKRFKKVGVGPLLSYDFETDALGVEVPVYLLSDNKNVLTGGIKLGWTDKGDRADELLATLFIGKAFLLGK
jgi:hypothetical protein